MSSYLDTGQFYFWRNVETQRSFVEIRGTRAEIIGVRIASNGVIFTIDSVLGRAQQSLGDRISEQLFAR